MMFLRKRRLGAARLCVGFSALAAVLQTLAYLLSYEAPRANYFAVGSILPVLAVVSAFVALSIGAALAFSQPKDAATETLPRKWASVFPAIFILLGCAVLLLSKSSGLTPFVLGSALLAVAYYLSVLLLPSRLTSATVLLGIAPVIFLVMLCALYYFDNHLETNAPLKNSLITGLLFALVQLTGELRILLGRAQPRMYLFLSSALIAFGSLTAIPVPVAFLLGVFDRDTTQNSQPLLSSIMDHTTYLAGAVVLLGIVTVTAIRFLGFITATAPEKEDI